MKMKFEHIARFGNYISKSFALDVLRLLYVYKDISASEAASRLGLHIQTIQDFLESLSELDILIKKEVIEGKRPYFRYSIKQNVIDLNLDFNELFADENLKNKTDLRIRERANSGVQFTTARGGQYFSTVSIWQGRGRLGKQKKINLTKAQGWFLYNLPFPDTTGMGIDEIMHKSGIAADQKGEIQDVVEELIELKIVEII
jgi:hypothetical protein